MRCCIISLFLLIICQNYRPAFGNRSRSRWRANTGETIRGQPSKGEHDKGEPSKSGASKGESSDEGPGPSKKQKTCDRKVCGKCEPEDCVCWKAEGKC